MKFMESIAETGTLKDALWQMMVDVVGVELSDEQLDDMSSNLSLSDILALDNAWTHNDSAAIKHIFKDTEVFEYVMPGRTGVTSAANTRQAPARKDFSGATKPAKTTAPTSTSTVTTVRKYSGSKSTTPQQQDPNAVTEGIQLLQVLSGIKK